MKNYTYLIALLSLLGISKNPQAQALSPAQQAVENQRNCIREDNENFCKGRMQSCFKSIDLYFTSTDQYYVEQLKRQSKAPARLDFKAPNTPKAMVKTLSPIEFLGLKSTITACFTEIFDDITLLQSLHDEKNIQPLFQRYITLLDKLEQVSDFSSNLTRQYDRKVLTELEKIPNITPDLSGHPQQVELEDELKRTKFSDFVLNNEILPIRRANIVSLLSDIQNAWEERFAEKALIGQQKEITIGGTVAFIPLAMALGHFVDRLTRFKRLRMVYTSARASKTFSSKQQILSRISYAGTQAGIESLSFGSALFGVFMGERALDRDGTETLLPFVSSQQIPIPPARYIRMPVSTAALDFNQLYASNELKKIITAATVAPFATHATLSALGLGLNHTKVGRMAKAAGEKVGGAKVKHLFSRMRSSLGSKLKAVKKTQKALKTAKRTKRIRAGLKVAAVASAATVNPVGIALAAGFLILDIALFAAVDYGIRESGILDLSDKDFKKMVNSAQAKVFEMNSQKIKLNYSKVNDAKTQEVLGNFSYAVTTREASARAPKLFAAMQYISGIAEKDDDYDVGDQIAVKKEIDSRLIRDSNNKIEHTRFFETLARLLILDAISQYGFDKAKIKDFINSNLVSNCRVIEELLTKDQKTAYQEYKQRLRDFNNQMITFLTDYQDGVISQEDYDNNYEDKINQKNRYREEGNLYLKAMFVNLYKEYHSQYLNWKNKKEMITSMHKKHEPHSLLFFFVTDSTDPATFVRGVNYRIYSSLVFGYKKECPDHIGLMLLLAHATLQYTYYSVNLEGHSPVFGIKYLEANNQFFGKALSYAESFNNPSLLTQVNIDTNQQRNTP